MAVVKAMVLTDYHGLSAQQMESLRQKILKAGGNYSVVKNTLLELVLEKKQSFEGPTAVLFALQDEILPIKALVEFIKQNELPTIKSGYLGVEELTAQEVLKLAQLPSCEDLFAKTIGQIATPISGLVRVLEGNLRQLVYVLTAIRQQQMESTRNTTGHL